MARRWGNPIVRPVLVRAVREIVARLGQPVLLLGADRRIVAANADACQAFALEPDDAVGRSIYDLADGSWDIPELREVLEHEIGARDVVQRWPLEHDLPGVGHRVFELTVVRIRGAWFDTGLTLLAFQDNTERARAETQLQGLLEAAPDGIVVVDESGTIRLVNRQAVTLFGYEREELLSQRVEMLVPEGVRNRHPGNRTRYLVEPRVRPMGAGLELAGRRKDGSEFAVDIALSPVQTDEELLVVAAVRDISERKQAERELAALEAQLRDAQRLESIGRLAGGIAHDFNNLLTVIRGHSSMALQDLPLDSGLRDDVEQISAAAERGSRLTQQLLAFSRRQVLQPVVLDLNGIIDGLAPMLRRLIGDDVELATVLQPDLGLVRADPGQLEQVIVNLVINARDAMPGGGKLTIETSNSELDEDYARRHAGVTPGRHVQLAVTDSGVGMNRQVLDRVFEPFFTTKELGAGTGLGLATVYGIVTQSGGSVRVYSELARGTTFKVYLPRVEGVAEPATQPEAALPLVGGSETVLVIEDDDPVRELLRGILEGYGYRVLAASSGDEALETATNGRPLDLLVTDLMLPGLHGREIAERLAATQPGLRVLYMSGYAENAVVHQGIFETGVHFLVKPFTPEELVRKVRQVLDEPRSG